MYMLCDKNISHIHEYKKLLTVSMILREGDNCLPENSAIS